MPTPEQPDALRDFADDAATRGMPVDAGTIEIAAVEASPEVRRRRKGLGFGAWLSIGWMVFVVGGALLAPYLPLDDPKESITAIARRGPFAEAGTAPGHLLGGDFNGRDMLSRLLWGGRVTLVVATAAVLLGFLLGGALGLVGGYFRGRIDIVVSLVLDVFLVDTRGDPGAGAGDDPPHATGIRRVRAGSTRRSRSILALGIVSIPVLGRITRASTLSWSEREFVLAAKAQGAKHRRILFREVLPNVLPGDVLDRAARDRGGNRRRRHAEHPRRERRARHPHVGQHDRDRAPVRPARAPYRVRARAHDLLHRARAQHAR